MKKLLIILCAFVSASALAQNSAISPTIMVNVVKEIIPANLDILTESVRFTDPSNNNAIDANETCYLTFKVKNRGKGDAMGCRTKVNIYGSTDGISVLEQSLPTIYAGQTQEISIPITTNMNTTDGSISIFYEITEPQGFGTDRAELKVPTKAFVKPLLQIVDYSITSAMGNSQLQKKMPFDLQLMLQNTQYGKAEDVSVKVYLPENVYMTDGQERISIPIIEGGSAKSLIYSLVVTNNYSGTTIPVKIELKEKYGQYAENKTITLQLNQTLASNKIIIDEVQEERHDIEIAMIGSTVDHNIPVTSEQNTNTFAVIIANERYKHVADVPYASNDGEVFRQYCISTLGIPEKQIKYIRDATLNDLTSNIKWLQNISNAWDSPNVIVYYAGHGIPDESSRSSYILPVDGYGSDVTTGYSLDNLYMDLGTLPAAKITVFMDACFSGATRENKMLAEARGVALKAKSGVPRGNMIVFSAAQGDETAYPYKDEGHGMFTYFLLKKLQETKGNVTLQELGNYISMNVKQQSLLHNDKSQTPCVIPSSALGDSWINWKLK